MNQICDGYNPRVRMGKNFDIKVTGFKNHILCLSQQGPTL